MPETRVCGEDKSMPFPRPKYFAEWNWNALAARRNGRTDEELGWYRVGMEANDPTSFEWAGLVYEEGRCTLPRDPAKAAEHYRRAGELGNWTSLIRLGLLTLLVRSAPFSTKKMFWFLFSLRGALIPKLINQNPCAHWRHPMDMIFHG